MRRRGGKGKIRQKERRGRGDREREKLEKGRKGGRGRARERKKEKNEQTQSEILGSKYPKNKSPVFTFYFLLPCGKNKIPSQTLKKTTNAANMEEVASK